MSMEIAIVDRGPRAAAVAEALKRAGAQVTLIDPAQERQPDDSPDEALCAPVVLVGLEAQGSPGPLQQLRELSNRGVATLALGEALTLEAWCDQALEAGAQDVIGWPLPPSLLLARVSAAWRGVQARAHVQRRFQQLADAMPFIVWTATLDGQMDYSNRHFFEYTGATSQLDASRRWRACLHPEDAPRCLEAWRTSVASGQPYEIEYRLRRVDGEHRWMRVQATLVRDPSGSPLAWYGTGVDVHQTKRLEREALALAERLGTTLESITDAFLILDPEWRFSYVNREAERLLLRPRHELLGANLWELFPEALGTPFEREYRRAARDGVSSSFEAYFEPLKTWFEVRVYPSSEGLALYFQDITRRRQDEAQLRLLQTCVDRMNDILLVTDASPDPMIVYVNEAFERHLGWSSREVLGQSPRLLRGPQTQSEALDRVREGLKQGRSMREEILVTTQRGGSLWLEVDIAPLRADDQAPTRWVFLMRDITARCQAEQMLREQATLLDHAQDAIFVQDMSGRITSWNKGAQRLLGWPAQEAIGRRAEDVLRVDPSTVGACAAQALAQGAWVGDLEVYTRAGVRRQVASRWSVLHHGDEPARGLLVINTDVTQQRSIEAQLLRAQRLESIGTLAGGIAHDLNNILTPILASVSMLREDERDPERVEDLDMMEASAKRGADLVRQLLTFARGSVGGERVPLDVVLVVQEVLKIVRDTFPKNIQASLKTGEHHWMIRANSTLIHQLLMNLCVNARDAMPQGGTLTLAVDGHVIDEVYAGMNAEVKPGPYVLIRVEDSGVGMSQEVQERIFEPFFTTKEVGKGTGLGLSTCHAIVRSHGGFIHVYSDLGKGARFKIYLPADVSAGVLEEATLQQTALPRGRGELVLIIDDEESVRHVASRTLERYGYRTLTASNGAEAVSLYVRHAPEVAVVLTDMSMPIMDGPTTIIALKSINPQVRIIGSSGLDANGKVAQALDAGVSLFVPKPYTAQQLLQTIRRALG